MTPCNFVSRYQRFGEICFFHFALIEDNAPDSYKIVKCHNPKDHNFTSETLDSADCRQVQTRTVDNSCNAVTNYFQKHVLYLCYVAERIVFYLRSVRDSWEEKWVNPIRTWYCRLILTCHTHYIVTEFVSMVFNRKKNVMNQQGKKTLFYETVIYYVDERPPQTGGSV